jgi:hypothetical protein
MDTKKSLTFSFTKNLIPVGLLVTVQLNQAVNAAQVETQAHIQEMTSLVQSALQQASTTAGLESNLAALSNAEINQQIHSTIEEAIKEQQKTTQAQQANSKLGFLQKVVTLECFFGGSDCLFRDKQAMMQGKVTEFAKKKFEEGNMHVEQYLNQINAQVAADLHASSQSKDTDKKVSKSYKLG